MNRRMSKIQTVVFAPLVPKAIYPLVGLLTAAGVVMRSLSIPRAPYASWDVVSPMWHEGLYPTLSLVSGISALVVAVLLPRGSQLEQRFRGQGEMRALLPLWTSLSAWTILGLGLGMAPVLYQGATTAVWGHPEASDALLGIVGVVSAVAMGVGLGAILRHWASGVIASLGYGALMVCATSLAGEPLRLVQPGQHNIPGPEFVPNSGPVIYAVTVSIVLSIAFLTSGAWALSHRRRQVLTTVSAAVAGVMLIAFAWVWNPIWADAAPVVKPVCASTPDVCVHPAHAPSMRTAVRSVERLRKVGGAELFGTAYDDSLFSTNDTAGHLAFSVDVRPVSPRLIGQTLSERVALAVASGALLGKCDSAALKDGRGELASAILVKVLRRADYEEVASATGSFGSGENAISLKGMSDMEFREHVVKNASELRNCLAVRDSS